MTSEKSNIGWCFLLVVVLVYIVVFFIDLENFLLSLGNFGDILLKIIPILFLVFILMALTNYFIKPKILVKYIGKNSGIKGWIIAIVGGIISTGPIYLWYPLLNDLQKKGVRNGLISTFIYNRAVKIPLLPMLFFYFGVTYSAILLVVMIFISVLQGFVTEKLMEVKT